MGSLHGHSAADFRAAGMPPLIMMIFRDTITRSRAHNATYGDIEFHIRSAAAASVNAGDDELPFASGAPELRPAILRGAICAGLMMIFHYSIRLLAASTRSAKFMSILAPDYREYRRGANMSAFRCAHARVAINRK